MYHEVPVLDLATSSSQPPAAASHQQRSHGPTCSCASAPAHARGLAPIRRSDRSAHRRRLMRDAPPPPAALRGSAACPLRSVERRSGYAA